MSPKKIVRVGFLVSCVAFAAFALGGGVWSPWWALLPAAPLSAAAFHFLVLDPFWRAA